MVRFRFEKPIIPNYEIYCQAKPKNKAVDRFAVVVDSREHSPWDFPDRKVIKKALSAGDYTIALEGIMKPMILEDYFRVERKSNISDLVSCVTTERERFEEELDELTTIEYPAVICEFTQEEFLKEGLLYKVNPAALWHSLIAWQAKYRIPFIMVPDIVMAKDAFLFLARKAVEQIL